MPTGISRERLASGQIVRHYERSTGETVDVMAPLVGGDDFERAAGVTTIGNGWAETETGTGVTAGVSADLGGGVMLLDTKAVDEDAVVLVRGPERINVGVGTTKYVQLEARIKITKGTSLAGHRGFFGFMGTAPTLSGTGDFGDADHHIGFLFGDICEGPGGTEVDNTNIYFSADDAVTDTAPIDSGADWTDATYAIYRLDMTDLTNVKFYKDGVRIGASLTIPFGGAATEAIATMSPVVALIKHTTECSTRNTLLHCDYVRYWGIR